MNSGQQNKEWRKGMEKYEQELRRMDYMEKEARQLAVIEELTEDFGCVNYVDLMADHPYDTTIYRISEKLAAFIPGWSDEQNSRERFRLFSQYAVYEADREKFNHETDRSVVVAHLAKSPAYFVNFRMLIDGTILYYQMKFTADYGENNSLKGFVVGIHSIDEEMRHEVERADQNAIIASLVDDFEFVGILDKFKGDLMIYRESSFFEKALESPQGGTITRSRLNSLLKRMVADEDMEEFNRRNAIETILEALERHPVYKFETRFKVDGQSKYYRIKFTQYKGNSSKVIVGLLNIDSQVRNEITIGEMKKELEYHNELRAAYDKAEAASKAKSMFLFNISHDVRTPMSAIMGFTDIAYRHIDEKERVLDCLKKIKNAGTHLLSLLNDVLDMSSIESGNIEISESPVDLVCIIEEIAPIIVPIAKDKNIDYHAVLGNVRDRYVHADMLHISQVVINLVTNAVKFTCEGGRVTMTLKQEDGVENGVGRYSIIVEDTGIGMSEEFMKHMFESFSRENRTEISQQQGAGLGLAITNRLVKLMKGSISAKSEIGKGSTFVVTLPLRLQELDTMPVVAHDGKPTDEMKTLEGKKILLVEDNELNREIANEILDEFGMHVDMACNGAESVEMVKKKGVHYYDAIIMDIQMPVMNGYEATEAIRKLPDDGKPVVIIALSANAFEEDKRKSLAVGMNTHISKPVKAAVLLDTLRKYINA